MTFDLILINTFTRFQSHYLPLIKYLSKDIKIGMVNSILPKAKEKLGETQNVFDGFCRRLGAVPVDINEKPLCSVLLMPQANYESEKVSAILEKVDYTKLIVTNTFGFGLDYMDELSTRGIHKFLVWDRQLFYKKWGRNKNSDEIIKRFDLDVMGSPFKSYPVFPEIEFDYLIALPSLMGMDTKEDQLQFIENVLKLIKGIGPARIALKPHNVKDGGNNVFSFRNVFALARFFYQLLINLKGCAGYTDEIIKSLGISSRYRSLSVRTELLQDVTSYFNLNLELFMPGIKRGLITGNSATTWFALANRLPVYNCGKDKSLIKGETLRENMECFGVPPCNGELRFDKDNFSNVSDEVRNGDLLEIIKNEI